MLKMDKLTIAEVKSILQQPKIKADILKHLAEDERQGVQRLLVSYQRRIEKQQKMQATFNERQVFEQAYWKKGQFVAGIDEVGRGPLAGPVVAAAVVLDDNFDLIEVHDSKQLSLKKREALVPKIKSQALDYAFGVVTSEQIDEINIYQAARVAMSEAYKGLQYNVNGLLIDAMDLDIELEQTSLIKGDDRSISIGAASILAKDYRDNLMAEYDLKYPGYDFKNNAGYGTAKHLAGLEKLGITPIHRKTFSPVKNYLN